MRFCNEDGEGHHADFHALRHTFITSIMKSGINPKTAQSLVRHCTIDMTMNVYTSLIVTTRPLPSLRCPG
jgi:integrase